jgi:hypothetical protein
MASAPIITDQGWPGGKLPGPIFLPEDGVAQSSTFKERQKRSFFVSAEWHRASRVTVKRTLTRPA